MSEGLYNQIITTLCGIILLSGLCLTLTRLDKFETILKRFPSLCGATIVTMLATTIAAFGFMALHHWPGFNNVKVEVMTVGLLCLEVLLLSFNTLRPKKVKPKPGITEIDGKEMLVTNTGKVIMKPKLPSEEIVARIRSDLQKWIDNNEYLKTNITIEAVARATYSNRTYISRFILVEFGCNFTAFVNSLRLKYAKNLLSEGDEKLTIVKISELSGFTSSTYFCRLFFQAERMNPTKWRMRNRVKKSTPQPETAEAPCEGQQITACS